MSEATEKLAASRQAILEHIARKQRRHDPREEPAEGFAFSGDEDDYQPWEDEVAAGGGWMRNMRFALRTWWRYHPAHMAVDLAAPVLRGYARRKPVQLLAISAAAGAALAFTRPWRLISLTGLGVAVLKSSKLSNLVMAALSAADFGKDKDRR